MLLAPRGPTIDLICFAAGNNGSSPQISYFPSLHPYVRPPPKKGFFMEQKKGFCWCSTTKMKHFLSLEYSKMDALFTKASKHYYYIDGTN
jgi:hypothetical protein